MCTVYYLCTSHHTVTVCLLCVMVLVVLVSRYQKIYFDNTLINVLKHVTIAMVKFLHQFDYTIFCRSDPPCAIIGHARLLGIVEYRWTVQEESLCNLC